MTKKKITKKTTKLQPKSRQKTQTSSNKKPLVHYKDPLRHFHPATSVILAGYRPSLSQNSVKAPLFRTSTFEFSSAKDGEKFFQRAYHLPGDDKKDPGLIYSRLNNPNIEIAEDKLVAAELGAAESLLFPSGMSAITTTILGLCEPNAKILYSDPVYGGTYFFLKTMCPQRFQIQTVPIDTSNLELVEKSLRSENFDIVYLESPTNPTMKLADIQGIREIIAKYSPKTLLVVDNTFLGPVFQAPLTLGADIVLYSATKFLGGHSDIIAGVVLAKDKKWISTIKDYRTILGCTTAPDTAWLLTRSIETLWVRMQRQAEKAQKVAVQLAKHPKIKTVYYPGLLTPKDKEQYKIFKAQCKGPGSMISFDLKVKERRKVFRFLDSLQICHLAVSLGGTESLIQHPRSMTHSDMTEFDLDRAQISESLVRLSVGLESSEDLIKDIFQALGKI